MGPLPPTDYSKVPISTNHTGATVSNLARSIRFYEEMFGFEVVMRQQKSGGYLGRIIGIPEAEVRMAQLRLPSGGHVLELFEYISPKLASRSVDPTTIGFTHLCLAVEGLQALHSRLSKKGCESISEPVRIDTGANAGGLGVYLRDPDGIIIELFESPIAEANRAVPASDGRSHVRGEEGSA